MQAGGEPPEGGGRREEASRRASLHHQALQPTTGGPRKRPLAVNRMGPSGTGSPSEESRAEAPDQGGRGREGEAAEWRLPQSGGEGRKTTRRAKSATCFSLRGLHYSDALNARLPAF